MSTSTTITNLSKELLLPLKLSHLSSYNPNLQTSNALLHPVLEHHVASVSYLKEFITQNHSEVSLARSIKEECQSILALLKCHFGERGDKKEEEEEDFCSSTLLSITISLLRNILLLTDKRYLSSPQQRTSMEEEVVRVLGKAFSLSLTDRSSKTEGDVVDFGRRWASVPIAIGLFRLYHRLSHQRLSQNIVRALDSAFSADCPAESRLPPLESFPQSIRVSYLFWRGLMALSTPVGSGGTGQWGSKENSLLWLDESYLLSARWRKRKIAIFLILSKMANFILPTPALLENLSLSAFYGPLIGAIKYGDLSAWKAFCEDDHVRSFFIFYKIWTQVELCVYPIILRSLIRRMYLSFVLC